MTVDELHRSLKRKRIYQEVEDERLYQDKKWGGPSHDDNEESEASWEKYVTEYANGRERAEHYDFRKRMIKAAALAVAAIESHDRLHGV